MTECKLVILPKGYRVVPEDITDDIRQAAYRLEDSFPDGTNPTVTEYYNCFIKSAPQLTTPPVLRWEDRISSIYLKCGNKILACVVRPEYEGDGITWFIHGEQPWHGAFSAPEARRAAEKALGFPDGLVVDVV